MLRKSKAHQQRTAGQDVVHKSDTALLIIDMINPMNFPEAKLLIREALPAARAIARLKARLKKRKVPVIYTNNNFGQWQSDWAKMYESVCHENSMAKSIAEILAPEKDDYFVLKPKHSAFYSTTLEILLEQMHCHRVIVTGMAANICVLFTVQDAHAREYEVVVPKDCVASNTHWETKQTLQQIQAIFKIRPVASASIR
jgi:nicotinamidase-related amidase